MKQEIILNLENIDLQKLSKLCNFHDCGKLPSKQLVVLEISKGRRKELVDIYLCDEHYAKNTRKIIKSLESSCDKGKAIDKKIFNIGYITH